MSATTVHFADQLSQMLSKVHGSHPGLRWTACGWSADDGSKLVIVTDRALVTCRGCKRTIAYRNAPVPVQPSMARQLAHERANQHPWPQEH